MQKPFIQGTNISFTHPLIESIFGSLITTEHFSKDMIHKQNEGFNSPGSSIPMLGAHSLPLWKLDTKKSDFSDLRHLIRKAKRRTKQYKMIV